jgi:hypothetical protein
VDCDRVTLEKGRWIMAEEGGFLDVMRDALSAMAQSAPVQEVGAEMGRMMTQGAAELASALFGGSDAYVAYGQGQQAVEVQAPQVEAPQQERGGMEM